MKQHNLIFKAKRLLLFLSLCSLGCANAGKAVGQQASPVGTNESYFKTLLVIGDDRSGSTSDIRKLTADDYRILIEAIGAKGGGSVAVCLIGNPKPQSREPYFLPLGTLEKVTVYDVKSNALTLTQRGQLKIANDKIIARNQEILRGEAKIITDFLNSKIMTNVIAYVAPAGRDQTDINDAVGRINTLVHEPQYETYDKIIVAMLSDGKNEPTGNKVIPIANKIQHPLGEFYLIGWETATSCFVGRKVNNMSSKDAFIEIIKNLKK
jgi:hypothetical protein